MGARISAAGGISPRAGATPPFITDVVGWWCIPRRPWLVLDDKARHRRSAVGIWISHPCCACRRSAQLYTFSGFDPEIPPARLNIWVPGCGGVRQRFAWAFPVSALFASRLSAHAWVCLLALPARASLRRALRLRECSPASRFSAPGFCFVHGSLERPRAGWSASVPGFCFAWGSRERPRVGSSARGG